MLKSCMGLVALSTLLLSSAAVAQDKIKVGVTATLEGTYTVLGEDGIRGFQTALNTLGKKVGDKELEFVIASAPVPHAGRVGAKSQAKRRWKPTTRHEIVVAASFRT